MLRSLFRVLISDSLFYSSKVFVVETSSLSLHHRNLRSYHPRLTTQEDAATRMTILTLLLIIPLQHRHDSSRAGSNRINCCNSCNRS
ncbi:hypothetical protein KC19_10G155600 [Ceratodon purpureus]|uniref:Uncharacterized protein n=1 Tax=Ceratodon purpureus TaxID=3225 RepID=A0A8T0GNF0_CERPU|nr:hypothetical protein KC19_10G155600 [Ceratodon purpureus]